MLKKGALLLFIASFAVCLPSKPKKTSPLHVRASRWLRWLGQVIFNDPQAVSLSWRNSAYEIDVPEPGVPTILCT